MVNKKFKIIIFILISCFFILLIFLIRQSFFKEDVIIKKNKNEVIKENLLEVYFLDVGQGDSILIKTPYDQNILIDGGPNNLVLNELGSILGFWDREIDLMILTHPHSDHVAGLVSVLERYNVKEVYYTGVLHTSPDYLAWLEEVKDQNIELKIVDKQFDLNLGEELVLKFLNPRGSLINQRPENLNNSSIINLLSYKEIDFLLMGDAEIEVEEDLLDQDLNLESEVLKLGHHGSASSSSEAFLKAVKPDYSIVSCGLDNEFNHPHLRVLNRLNRLGLNFLRTDQLDTIKFTTNGQNLIY